MIIAIPVNGTVLNGHFGKSTVFEIAKLDLQNKRIVSRKTLDLSAGGGCAALPQALKNEGVETVVCGGIGQGAVANLKRVGIDVLAGSPEVPPLEIFNLLLEGAVADQGSNCGCHGRDSDHAHEHGEGGCGCSNH
jgi:predicted Fe-Mo cluster-binding NifX family protein